MKEKRAFTLIELIVVIAVICVIAGILLPAFGRAKQGASGAACVNNLRQWGIATHLYIAENRDSLPPEGAPNPTDNDTNVGWYVQLPQFLNLPSYHAMPWRTNAGAVIRSSIWICPSNSRRSNGKNLFHYCLNEYVNGSGNENYSVNLLSVARPSAVVWLFDSKNLPAVGTQNFVHTNLHAAGAHLLFLDGHVRQFRNVEYWNFKSNKGVTNNPEIVWIP
jgi:prepilin-type N-terminal cleavage/methylation domain-containing protein/prepilin-type processing-associated H-X9-DG protein